MQKDPARVSLPCAMSDASDKYLELARLDVDHNKERPQCATLLTEETSFQRDREDPT